MVVPGSPPVPASKSRSFAHLLRAGSTPDRLRALAIVTVLVVVGIGTLAWWLTDRLVSETDQVATSTGEVLIATQQVNASFAEADAAAVSVHLAGADGNREQRRLYEQAMDRATVSLERVARLVGDDEPSHEALGDIANQSTRYAGLIEAARLSSVEGLAAADLILAQASVLNRDDIAPDVQLVTERARNRFSSETSSSWYLFAIAAMILAALVLLGGQYFLFRRFRRLVNLPLALATVALLLVTVMAGRSFATQRQAFDEAEQGAYDAIVVSEQIQQTAYRHRAIGTAAVLSNADVSSQLSEFSTTLGSLDSGLLERSFDEADSERERAGATEVVDRWERYEAQSELVQAAIARGDVAQAEALTQGPANQAFNGFNTSAEAALLDNREQFLGELERAADSLRWLRGVIIGGALLAAVLAWWGFSLRIGEYR